MKRRDSGKALIIAAMALATAASLTACAAVGGQNAADFPKFSDIPAKPLAGGPTPASDAEIRTLRAMADKLAKDAGPETAESRWADSARARAAAPAATPAEIDAEAYARAARARAAPPPTRK
jgi:hypothetical protein